MSYDKSNIFAKIIRKEITSTKIFHETEFSLAFFDIYPAAKIHILVVPKGEYVTYDEFLEKGTIEEQLDFLQTINFVIKKNNLDKDGYRIIMNAGENGRQVVFHLHAHILGGTKLNSHFDKN